MFIRCPLNYFFGLVSGNERLLNKYAEERMARLCMILMLWFEFLGPAEPEDLPLSFLVT